MRRDFGDTGLQDGQASSLAIIETPRKKWRPSVSAATLYFGAFANIGTYALATLIGASILESAGHGGYRHNKTCMVLTSVIGVMVLQIPVFLIATGFAMVACCKAMRSMVSRISPWWEFTPDSAAFFDKLNELSNGREFSRLFNLPQSSSTDDILAASSNLTVIMHGHAVGQTQRDQATQQITNARIALDSTSTKGCSLIGLIKEPFSRPYGGEWSTCGAYLLFQCFLGLGVLPVILGHYIAQQAPELLLGLDECSLKTNEAAIALGTTILFLPLSGLILLLPCMLEKTLQQAVSGPAEAKGDEEDSGDEEDQITPYHRMGS